MKNLVQQASDLLKDVSNFGVTSIEQTAKIDRLVFKLESIEDEQLILAKIDGLIQKHGRDIEALNSDTEKIIESLLSQLGYEKLVKKLENLTTWNV